MPFRRKLPIKPKRELVGERNTNTGINRGQELKERVTGKAPQRTKFDKLGRFAHKVGKGFIDYSMNVAERYEMEAKRKKKKGKKKDYNAFDFDIGF